MKKKMIFVVIFFFILSLSNAIAEEIHVGKKGFEFHSIQQAIDQAESGDAIIVHEGLYDEAIDVYKKLRLIGIENPIIVHNISDDGISVTVDNCQIKGFIIQNITNASFSGINIGSNGNIIENMIIRNNTGNGVYMHRSHNNVLRNNTLINDSICIVGDKTAWTSSVIENNTVNNLPVFYYKNKQNGSLTNARIGQLILANCSHFTIRNCTLTNGDEAITLGFSLNNTITFNTFISNKKGLRLQYSDTNVLSHNTFLDNEYGLYITHSFDNDVFQNEFIQNTKYGCWICCNSNQNRLYQNNFSQNTKSAYDIFDNTWFKNGIGNQWSEYTGKDKDDDGIGDIPYEIPPDYASAQDPYPVVDYQKIGNKYNEDSSGFTIFLLLSTILIFLIAKRLKNKS